jgi:pimeloyl-ACP methyl ester carboxylesterase
MSSFLLIHGAFHGAWCWERVTPRLVARGHAVQAIDLPGHGDDPTPPGAVGFEDYVARVGQALATIPTPAVLVGHSLGGVSITAAADRWPENVAALVYLAALVPAREDGMASFRPEPVLSEMMLPPVDGAISLDATHARTVWYHDCSDADVTRALRLLKPQPARVLGEVKVEMAPERFGRVLRHYVECLQDRAIGIAAQREMHRRVGCVAHTLDSSHSPFFSMPEQLAEVLDRIARA